MHFTETKHRNILVCYKQNSFQQKGNLPAYDWYEIFIVAKDNQADTRTLVKDKSSEYCNVMPHQTRSSATLTQIPVRYGGRAEGRGHQSVMSAVSIVTTNHIRETRHEIGLKLGKSSKCSFHVHVKLGQKEKESSEWMNRETDGQTDQTDRWMNGQTKQTNKKTSGCRDIWK